MSQFTLMTFLTLMALAVHFGGMTTKFVVMSRSTLPILKTPTISWLLLAIGMFLVLSILGLCYRNLLGILVSALSLAAILAAYCLWYWVTRLDRQLYESDNFFRSHPEAMAPHPLGFVEGAWWNLIVLGVTLILLAWHLKILLTSRARRGQPEAN